MNIGMRNKKIKLFFKRDLGLIVEILLIGIFKITKTLSTIKAI
jgi:hypothetical protein